MSNFKSSVITVVLFLSLCASSFGATILVPSQQPTIQAAINAAADGDEIVLAAGTHTGAGNRDLDTKKKALTLRSTNPSSAAVVAATIVDSQGTAAAPHRLVYVDRNKGHVAIAISGLTITGGYSPKQGGAILVNLVPVTISKCHFVSNKASMGGAITVTHKTQVLDCTFENNEATGYGGAVVLTHSGAIMSGCTVRNNKAQYGGGIGLLEGMPKLKNTIIENNEASIHGGGLYITNPRSVVPYLHHEKVMNCIIMNNKAGQGGGGVAFEHSGPVFAGCTIANNEAAKGGGVYLTGKIGPSALLNCVVWNNTAPNGHEIAVEGKRSLTLSYCDVMMTGSSAVHVAPTASITWNDCITVDPMLTSTGRLGSGSPCIDMGNPTWPTDPNYGYASQVDIDNQPRLSGSSVEIGADEIVSGGKSPSVDDPQKCSQKGGMVGCILFCMMGLTIMRYRK